MTGSVPSSDPARRFRDILDEIDRIERFTEGMDRQAFAADERTVYAVKHGLLVISEAARKLGTVAPRLAAATPWPEIRALGNRLRHEYEVIKVERIWLMIERDLPPLRSACVGALADLADRDQPS